MPKSASLASVRSHVLRRIAQASRSNAMRYRIQSWRNKNSMRAASPSEAAAQTLSMRAPNPPPP